jgi:RNA ligase
VMEKYVKINTIWKRDSSREGRDRIIPGSWATPELEYLSQNSWRFTEKVDGTNIRVHLHPRETDAAPATLDYGGRTDDAQISTHVLRHLDATFRSPEGLTRLLTVFPRGGVTLYGEGFGDQVNRQERRSYLPGASFVLFDVLAHSEEGPLWLERANVEDVAERLALPVVPEVGTGTLLDAAEQVERGLLPSAWGDFHVEGLVMRPLVELKTRRGERVIAKIKVTDYERLRRLEARDAASTTREMRT